MKHLILVPINLVLMSVLATIATAGSLTFIEDLGNFPDAIAVNAEFNTFQNTFVNGVDISGKTGFLFRLENTSLSGESDTAAQFRNDPDGDFAVNDVLTVAAATAIGTNHSFGIFKFGTNMETTVAQGLNNGTLMAIAPVGFELNVEGLGGSDPEVNFEIDSINFLDGGLLFDDDAAIPSIFSNSKTGELEFFIEVNKSLDAILDATSGSINERGLDIVTSMAWAENGSVSVSFNAPGTTFEEEALRPRGQLVLVEGQITSVPEPSVFVLLFVGLSAFIIRRFSPDKWQKRAL